MPKLGDLLQLEYGAALSAEARSGYGFPVYGSNGEVGRHSKALVLEPGIIVGRKGSVGQVCWSNEQFWPIDTAYWVRCSPENRRWLFWLLSFLPLGQLDTSTGVPGLNRNDVYALDAVLPARPERAKIAEILDTLDEAIRGTEAVVAKLKAMKQGLLHDLLTRGINANGDLRPPAHEAPHLYHETPLGWLPKEWEVDTLSRTVASLDAGVSVNAEDRPHSAGEIGVLKTSAVLGGDFFPHENKAVWPGEMRRVAEPVRADSILISRMNTPALVGETAYVSSVFDNLFLPDRLWQVKLKPSLRTVTRWLAYTFQHKRYRDYVEVHATGTSGTMKNLPKRALLQMPMAFPPTNEQRAVVQCMETLSEKLDSEMALLTKLRLQKSGLMDDLLTGRVSVTPLL